MEKYKSRQIITAAISLIVIAVAIAALIYAARVLFFNNGTNIAQINASQQALIDTTADRSVRMTVRGPIVSNETFRSYQITLEPGIRSLTINKGYIGQVVSDTKLGNNIPAYEQFVYALDKANMMRGTELTGDNNDLRGVCAAGRVYEFQILNANKSEKQLWTTSCSTARGSLNASLDSLTRLFDAQIPDFTKLTADLW